MHNSSWGREVAIFLTENRHDSPLLRELIFPLVTVELNHSQPGEPSVQTT